MGKVIGPNGKQTGEIQMLNRCINRFLEENSNKSTDEAALFKVLNKANVNVYVTDIPPAPPKGLRSFELAGIDIDPNSKTYGKHQSFKLESDNNLNIHTVTKTTPDSVSANTTDFLNTIKEEIISKKEPDAPSTSHGFSK